ncbi:MAG: DMT family transporter [Deltaproteobacteria bacterium]|nr:MAG: DMT family transporter [Deltaproteobacteria bacterium]
MKLSRGVLYMAASAFGFSAMGVLVKLASPRLPLSEIVFARAIVTVVLSYAMVRRAGLSPWGNQRMSLVLRGVLGFGGLTCYYIALSRLPLADATTLQNVTPVLTAVLAWWLIGEPISGSTAAAIAFGIAGVALIIRPSGDPLDPVGIGVAMGAVVCSSFAYVTVRKLGRTEHPLVIVFYFPLVATPLTLPWMLSAFVMPRPLDWLLLLGLGIATQIGQVFLTKALMIESASRATTVGYLQVAFAMVWQLLVFGDLPTPWTIAGAGLILGGTLLVAQMPSWLAGRAE